MFLSTGKLLLLNPECQVIHLPFIRFLLNHSYLKQTEKNFTEIFSYLKKKKKKKEVNFWSLKLTYLKRLFVIVGLKLLIPPTCFFLKLILAEARNKKKLVTCVSLQSMYVYF